MGEKAFVAAEKDQRKTRTGLLVFSALYVTFYAGAFFGWGPMQLLLEENGAYAWKCTNENVGNNNNNHNEVCGKQTSSLLNVQLVAQLTLVFSPFLGQVADRYGAAVLMTFLASSGIVGIALLMVASATSSTDALLFVAFACIGLMSVSTSINIVQTGMVFRGKTQRRVISCLNALFDAGSITYLGLWAISNSTGATLVQISGVYLAVAVVCFGGAVYYWWNVIPVAAEDSDIVAGRTTEEDGPSTSSSAPTKEDGVNNVDDITPVENVSGINVAAEEKSSLPNSEHKNDGGDEFGENSIAQEGSENESSKTTGGTEPKLDYILIALRKPMEQLKSGQFVTLSFFFAFHTARNIYILTTARDFLAYLGDDETGNKYLSIFTLLMPASVLGLPFADQGLQRYGYHAGLQAINCLAIIQSTIQLSSENLNVQVVGFVVFSFYRCFLFTVVFSFIPLFLGANVVGKGAGILVCVAGLASFINIPLANLAINVFDGNFFWPNLFYTVLVLPCIYAAWRMGQGIQREKMAAAQTTTVLPSMLTAAAATQPPRGVSDED